MREVIALVPIIILSTLRRPNFISVCFTSPHVTTGKEGEFLESVPEGKTIVVVYKIGQIREQELDVFFGC